MTDGGQTMDKIIIHPSQVVIFSHGEKEGVSKNLQDALFIFIDVMQGAGCIVKQ